MSLLITCAVTALFPLIFGFIWYNPKVFGKPWMEGAGLTEADAKTMNMPLVFGLTYVFSFFIALSLHGVTIHQFGAGGLLEPSQGYTDPEGALTTLTDALKLFENKFRSFKHGALHGGLAGVFFILPVIAIDAMFGRKNWKYILINAGYWIISLAVMGGVVCQFSGR
ncbi:MAG: DUF1761 domain-containing protein [Bacteroidota bacterium]